MLTLENTLEAIKRAQTYLDCDMTSSGTITVAKAELAEINAAQATVTHNKRRRDGVSNNGAVTCQKCGRNHSRHQSTMRNDAPNAHMP